MKMAAIEDPRFEDADEDMPLNAEKKSLSDSRLQSEQGANAEDCHVTRNEVYKNTVISI